MNVFIGFMYVLIGFFMGYGVAEEYIAGQMTIEGVFIYLAIAVLGYFITVGLCASD